jgi:Carboxypeptidase regulatory-like domain/TonB dependent receptor
MLFHERPAQLCAAATKLLRACLVWRCAAAIVAVTAIAPLASAQTAVDGAISGFVLDAGRAALAGATIQIRNLTAGTSIQISTGDRGEFSVAHLAAGEYQLTVEYALFNRLTLQPVLVEVGGVTSIEAHLRLATATTSITVKAEPEPFISVNVDDLSSTATGGVVTPGEIERIPVNGRRWQTFALMMPGVNPDPEGDGLLSFHGAAPTQNSSRIDGGDDDQSFSSVPRGVGVNMTSELEEAIETGTPSRITIGSASGGGGYGRHSGMAYTFSQEAVREFRVTSQNYSALYGHAAGGIITTVSKSGTNDLHGTGFYLFRTSVLAATNPFSIATTYVNGVTSNTTVKPNDLRQQFGGSIGGAAIRDRLFFFYAYDQQTRDFPAISTPQDPNFFSLTPTQKALLANRGVTTAKIRTALNYLNSLFGTIARRQDQAINFAKFDWQAAPQHRLSLQYNRARSSSPAGSRSSPVVDVGRASLGSAYGKIDAVLGRWTWLATPTLSNDLRIQYGRDLQYEQAQPPLPQEPAIGPAGSAPEIAIGPDGFTFGSSPSLGRKALPDEKKLQLVDLIIWTHGRSQLQLGADLSLVHDNINALPNTQGAFHYDSTITSGHAGGLVDWITDYTFNVNSNPNGGCPSILSPVHDFCFRSFTQSFGQQSVTFNTQEWAIFLQDTWRIHPTLTVNAGLRYEYEFLPLPQQPNATLDAAFGTIGATSIFPEDRNNFGPRIGLAWEPFGSGRGLIRIGYGLFYGRLPGATIQSALVNTAQSSSTRHILITPTTVTNCPQVSNQGFGYVCTYLTTPPSAVATTTSAMLFALRFRLPMVQQGSFTIERELGAGVIGSATYLINLDRQLPNSVDINIAPSSATKAFELQGGTGAPGVRDSETFVVPFYTQRRNTSFGPVTAIVSNTDATYNALVLEARRRLHQTFEFRASWTWSKAIDNNQSGAAPRTNAQFDPFNPLYDKGLSALNFPRKIQASAVWEPAPASEQRWLHIAANNWTIAPLFVESSGRPYSLEIFGGARLAGGHETINGSGGATYLPTVGRNTLRLPDTARIDLRISRAIRVTEKLRMRGSIEIFNLTNRVNYSAIMERAYLVGTETGGVTPLIFQNATTVAAEGLNVRPFGTFTAASAGQSAERQIQLGLRIEF